MAAESCDLVGEDAGKGRAPRPLTSRFDVTELVNQWAPEAKKRRPRVPWDGSGYPSMGRSLSPSMSGLARHAPTLKTLLLMAPTGFPSHPMSKAAFLKMHDHWKMMGEDMPERKTPKTAAGWRTAGASCAATYT